MFTFLPASTIQLAVLLLEIWAVSPPTNGNIRSLRADLYLRDFNVIFSIYFGLLAVWWTSARTEPLAQGQLSAAKEDKDMSLVDWALGPIEPEVSRHHLLRPESHDQRIRSESLVPLSSSLQ